MNQPLNPYAVTTTGEHPLDPIHFGGVLTRDDLMMALRDSAPKTGLGRLAYPATLLLLVAVGVFMIKDYRAEGETPPAILWMTVAFMLLPGWFQMTRLFTPGRRQQVERINNLAEKQTLTRGWIDEQLVVLCDRHSAIRARWSFFAAPLIFPEHLLLPLTGDGNRRVVFPWRFFTTTDDIRVLCQTIKARNILVDELCKEQKLAKLVAQREPYLPVDVAQSRGWSGEDWPFASSAEGQFDCTVDFAAQMSTARFVFSSAIGIAFVLVWSFLPVWVAAVGWFAAQYWSWGDWGFVGQRLWSSLLILVPTAVAGAFCLYVVAGSVFKSRHVQKQPYKIRLRATGIHLAHETFESWFAWNSVRDVIADDDNTGWITDDSGEEVKFPKICFDNDESFQACKTAMKTFFAAIQPEHVSKSENERYAGKVGANGDP